MSSSSYADGLKVKIADKYKPPKRINLVMSYSQRILLNKQIRENFPDYDFSVESNIIENMERLRSKRSSDLEAKKIKWNEARLDFEKESAKRLEEAKNKIVESTIKPAETPLNTTPQNYLSSGILMPTQATYSYSNILTPVPLMQHKNLFQNKQNSDNKRPFNISDFEEDTASPFDNMELKSINDMEELAQVLKTDFSQFATGSQYTNFNSIPNMYVHPVTSSYSQTNGYYYHPSHVNSTTSSHITSFSNCKSEANNSNLNLTNHVISEAKEEKLEDPFDDLSMKDQDLCRNICSMGFPLPRVARACKLLGHDHKKVLEHLLALSELLDLGFSESIVSNALVSCDNDKDKALDSLIS